MRILLLSDIHSNLEALQACLAAAPAHDAVVNLGDIVGYGANPNEVTQKARELGGTFVRGNHDKVVAGIDSAETFNPIAAIAALWNREQLTDENLDWVRALPKGPVPAQQLPGIQFVHGAPDDEDRYVVTVEDSAASFAASTEPVTFFGHTHIQCAFTLRSGRIDDTIPEYATIGKPETWEFRLDSGSNYLINPGSVGQPRDGDWRAAFAVFDSERLIVTFCRVPYELRSAQEKIFAANLPARLATRLAAGR
ncbi:MAG TPA: metallophosphoesterase family protein [Terriglobales bacterium]|nr:metallophosphoesterase family protein [Terriglobales bacterium]